MIGRAFSSDVPQVLAGKPEEHWFRRVVRLLVELRDAVQGGRHGKLILAAEATQVITNTTAIEADAPIVRISAAANLAIDAVPTIADGTDGQLICVTNVGSATIEIKDQGSLAGSNLRLEGITVLSARQSIWFRYDEVVGDWLQVGKKVAVL